MLEIQNVGVEWIYGHNPRHVVFQWLAFVGQYYVNCCLTRKLPAASLIVERKQADNKLLFSRHFDVAQLPLADPHEPAPSQHQVI